MGIMSFYDEGKACVRVGYMVSESFVVKMGLRQGCVMSPWMFNMFINGVVREVNSRVNGMGVKMNEDGEREWVMSQLLFADDSYRSSGRIGRTAAVPGSGIWQGV